MPVAPSSQPPGTPPDGRRETHVSKGGAHTAGRMGVKRAALESNVLHWSQTCCIGVKRAALESNVQHQSQTCCIRVKCAALESSVLH